MEGHLAETPAVSKLGATRSHEWVHRVISLLEAAVGQLHDQVHPAQGTLLEAASLLRQQIDPPAANEVPDGRGRLLTWQARKVRDYIDSHITGPVLVADLCALVQRSEAHFSRAFKCTFGESPHVFPGATSRGTGRSIHAYDRCFLERHCAAVRLHRPGALVQAVPAGRGPDPCGLETCAQVVP